MGGVPPWSSWHSIRRLRYEPSLEFSSGYPYNCPWWSASGPATTLMWTPRVTSAWTCRRTRGLLCMKSGPSCSPSRACSEKPPSIAHITHMGLSPRKTSQPLRSTSKKPMQSRTPAKNLGCPASLLGYVFIFSLDGLSCLDFCIGLCIFSCGVIFVCLCFKKISVWAPVRSTHYLSIIYLSSTYLSIY